MSILHRFNTIRLSVNVDTNKVVTTEFIGFGMDDKILTALHDAKLYWAQTSRERKKTISPGMNEIRSNICAEIKQKKKHYANKELESLADRFLSPGNATTQHDAWRSIYNKTIKLQQDYELILSIADQLIKAQQLYLCSRNWMDKKKNTYLHLASQHPECSEATLRRKIKTLNLKLGEWKFSATDLLCANDLPQLCKQVNRILEIHPNAGRPTLCRLLHEEGYHFSDRHIGNAIKLLRNAQRHETFNL